MAETSTGTSTTLANGPATDGTGVVDLDPWLSPFKEQLRSRYNKAQSWIKTIDQTEGGLEKFSRVRRH